MKITKNVEVNALKCKNLASEVSQLHKEIEQMTTKMEKQRNLNKTEYEIANPDPHTVELFERMDENSSLEIRL